MSESINLAEFDELQMVAVGSFGKSVGLNGGVRVFLLSDFAEVLRPKTRFYLPFQSCFSLLKIMESNYGKFTESKNLQNLNAKNHATDSIKKPYLAITLKSYNAKNHTAIFYGISERNAADTLRNITFFSTIDETRQSCILREDEFFYFDIIGLKVVENDEVLGVVSDIQEIANTHYFVLEANFLIPYIDRYVAQIDVKNGVILTRDAKYLKM